MKLNKLIPNIFYGDIQPGLDFFVGCLGFRLVYSAPKAEQPLYIVERDSVTIMLLENDEFAKKDRPSVRIDTDDIEVLVDEIERKGLDFFHPNLSIVTRQPWGLKEFALRDNTGVYVIIQQTITS